MYRGINKITNKGLGFKLTNSMSLGEYVFSAGNIQKTIKADLHVRVNYAIPSWNQHGKVPEDSRGLHTEAGGEALPCRKGRPHLQAARPLSTKHDRQSTKGYAQGSDLSVDRCASYELDGDARHKTRFYPGSAAVRA
jgi:hypothetical protein